ncbi:MAG: hypothetical protein K9M75_05480 [Phycisphaerae bacterium]|nr:hypothetical protein [Phycisphaerae bacterium]
MIKYIRSASIIVILLSSFCSGDFFKHRQSGETFYGYPTNRTLGKKTRIYEEKDGKFFGKTVLIDEYDITYNARGRKENLVVIGIDDQDIILSDTVSKTLAKTIEEAANNGTCCIILEIDSPGGRGAYMKQVCDSIRKSYNCPIFAFITGKKYGGAFSAAAGIALACDKIYIAPHAQIGTIAAPIDATIRQEGPSQWQDTFTPKSIASFAAYLSTFAEKNKRPAAMAMALVDRNVEVVEVVTDEQGSRNIVHKGDKGSSAIVRTWSTASTIYQDGNRSKDDESDKTQQSTYAITLSAKDAMYTKMADAIVSSRDEVIKDLKADGLKVIDTNRINLQVRQFAKSKIQLLKYFAGMEELESQAEEIEKNMKEVSSAALKNAPSREDERLRRLERKAYENRLIRNRDNKNVVRQSADDYRKNGNLTRQELANLQQEVADSYVNPYLLQQQRLATELAYILDDLLVYYSRAAKIAKQYPAALPEGKTIRELQLKYNTAVTKLNNMGF